MGFSTCIFVFASLDILLFSSAFCGDANSALILFGDFFGVFTGVFSDILCGVFFGVLSFSFLLSGLFCGDFFFGVSLFLEPVVFLVSVLMISLFTDFSRFFGGELLQLR